MKLEEIVTIFEREIIEQLIGYCSVRNMWEQSEVYIEEIKSVKMKGADTTVVILN